MSNAKVLIIHRAYRNRGGEDSFLDEILKPALMTAGLDFECLVLPSLSLSLWRPGDFLELFGMVTGFEGIRPSLRACLDRIQRGGFSHILLNNCLPTVSLSVARMAKSRSLKTLMWVHNFRLDCANGLHFDGKNICHQCLNAGSRWSFFLNCQGSWFQSLIYALVYRRRRIALKIVPFIDHFICNSEFTRASLRGALDKMGLKSSSSVISMPVSNESPSVEPNKLIELVDGLPKPFYLFLGRVSFEKGADIFVGLARKYPERGFLMCGDGPMLEELRKASTGITNLAFAGRVDANEKPWLFKNSEALIIPSRTPETSSLVISESQSAGTPVVYPEGGGAEETFKLLGRTGCTLSEFKGQTFIRGSTNAKALSLNDFAMSLKSTLLELR